MNNLKAFFESVIRFTHKTMGGLKERHEILIGLIYNYHVEVIIDKKKYFISGNEEMVRKLEDIENKLTRYSQLFLEILEFKDKYFSLLDLLKLLDLVKDQNSSLWRVLIYFITEFYFTFECEFDSIESLSFEIDFLHAMGLGEEDPNYFFHELPQQMEEVLEITKEEFYGKN